LASLTCIGIETLGEIFVTSDKDDISLQFITILKQLNQIFGRKPNQKYQAQLEAIWTAKDLNNISSYGKIVYRFFRNTMIHGFQGKGMFLSYEGTKNITIDDASAFIVINPDWFWEIFKAFFYKQFDLAKKAQANSNERKNCLNYINTFLLV
jgi:hypothetical protein